VSQRTSLFAHVWLALALTTLAACDRRARPDERTQSSVDDARRAPLRVPPFRFVDQNGRFVTAADLLGHVWIFDFVYTSCTSVCPTLTAKLVMLERELDDAELRFVSFSVDSERDTPEALAAYAGRFRPGETRWLLLATEATALTSFARGFDVAVQRTPDARDPIRHSTAFFLVNREGVVAQRYDSTDPSALARLRRDAAALAHAAVSAKPVEPARELIAALGCNGCHLNAELAPPLAPLGGSIVELADGRRVVRGEAYLREAILEPSAALVRGYPDRMPAYGADLSRPDLDALVAYLMAGPAVATSARPGVAPSGSSVDVATDVVCGMDVRVVARTPHADLDGRRYFFCSEKCRDQFEANHAGSAH
jgi:protein SCO1/2